MKLPLDGRSWAEGTWRFLQREHSNFLRQQKCQEKTTDRFVKLFTLTTWQRPDVVAIQTNRRWGHPWADLA